MKALKILCCSLFLTGCGFETVDTGRRGLKITLGEIKGDPLPEGLYFYNPFTSDVKEISVREDRIEGKTSCYTKDTQTVTLTFSILYSPEPAKVGKLYEKHGDREEWDAKLITPVLESTTKDIVGKYDANNLIAQREQAKDQIQKVMTKKMGKAGLLISSLDIVDLSFEKAYEKAVENKVVAIQKAEEAKNRTVEIQEKANQKIIAAEAEAKSMKIRSEALKQNKGLVEYEAVQKWDGKLPTYMLGGNSMPFINLQKGKG